MLSTYLHSDATTHMGSLVLQVLEEPRRECGIGARGILLLLDITVCITGCSNSLLSNRNRKQNSSKCILKKKSAHWGSQLLHFFCALLRVAANGLLWLSLLTYIFQLRYKVLVICP